LNIRKHEGKVVVKQIKTVWCSDTWELPCANCERVRMAFALDRCELEIMSWASTKKGIDAGLIDDLMMQKHWGRRFGTNKRRPSQLMTHIEWRSLDDGRDKYFCQVAGA
jgi:putative transposase